MAAIDKLYVKNYWDFAILRLWVLINNPSLLVNIYNPFDTEYKGWEKRKEELYEDAKRTAMLFFNKYPTLEDFRKVHKDGMKDDDIVHDYNSMVNLKDSLQDEWKYKDNISFPIATFSLKQDRWLFWHCPLDFVREYLKEQCGYKEKWYHKIIFKLTWKQEN